MPGGIELPLDEALKRLRLREEELARVQRIGQIGGLEVDLREGAFRNKRSPEYLAVHGLPPESENETHEAWVARIHPEDRDRVVSHFHRSVFGTDVEYEAEYRIVRPSDGAVRWILAKAEIQRDELGKPVYLELSSVNPVLFLPGALAERGQTGIGEGVLDRSSSIPDRQHGDVL